MFDVSWEDPTSETVAQRRERKERDERTGSKDSRGSSVKSADSNESLKPQLSRLLTVFTKGGSQKKHSPPKGSISLSKNSNLAPAEENHSINTTSTDLDSQRTITNTGEGRLHDLHHEGRDSVTNTRQSTQVSNGMFSSIL
jgi:ribosome assembly protein YihI (activator of Der GTPase)